MHWVRWCSSLGSTNWTRPTTFSYSLHVARVGFFVCAHFLTNIRGLSFSRCPPRLRIRDNGHFLCIPLSYPKPSTASDSKLFYNYFSLRNFMPNPTKSCGIMQPTPPVLHAFKLSFGIISILSFKIKSCRINWMLYTCLKKTKSWTHNPLVVSSKLTRPTKHKPREINHFTRLFLAFRWPILFYILGFVLHSPLKPPTFAPLHPVSPRSIFSIKWRKFGFRGLHQLTLTMPHIMHRHTAVFMTQQITRCIKS